MRNTIDFILRWFSTKAGILLSKTIAAAVTLSVTCIAVRSGVFEEFGATRTCCFAIAMASVWTGLFNSLCLFYSERDYMMDDLIKFLPVHAYVAGNVIIQFIQSLLEAGVSVSVFTLFFDYEKEGIVFSNKNIDLLITFFLIIFSLDMLGFLAGTMINGINSITTAVPAILVVQLLFSGCLFELDEHIEVIAYITSARWGFYSLGSIFNLNSLLQVGGESIFKPEAEYLWYCWRYMILLAIIFILLSGTCLYFKMKRTKS